MRNLTISQVTPVVKVLAILLCVVMPLLANCQPEQVFVDVPVTVEVPATVEVTRQITRVVETQVTVVVTVPIEVTRIVIATPRPEDTPVPSPTPEVLANADRFLVSNFDPSELPLGTEGEISVVAAGLVDRRGNMPIIVRNNTGQPVVNINASVTVRAADGSLLGTGDAEDFSPTYVVPGGLAIAEAEFDATVPSDAGFEFRVVAEDASTSTFYRDLEIAEYNQIGTRLLGMLLNSTGVSLQGIRVQAICLDDSLDPLAYGSRYTDQDSVDNGDQLPFDMVVDVSTCSKVIIASKGYELD